jgi:hypothetical protein
MPSVTVVKLSKFSSPVALTLSLFASEISRRFGTDEDVILNVCDCPTFKSETDSEPTSENEGEFSAIEDGCRRMLKGAVFVSWSHVFPVYSWLQAHEKSLTLLVHTAPFLQGELVHSSISMHCCGLL